MKTRSVLAIGFLASTLLTGCLEQDVSCTLIGCMDQLEVRLKPAAGSLPTGVYSVLVKSSDFEKTFSCGIGTASEQCSTQSTHQEEMFFVDNALVLMLQRQPASVTITTSRDGTKIDEATLTPKYDPVYPNGVECGAVCEQGKAEVVLE